MAYFMTAEQYAPGLLYETDASLELVQQWLDARGDSLAVYFVGGYIGTEVDERVNSEEMARDIGRITADRNMQAAKREVYLSALSPEERYREENTLRVQNLDNLMHTALFPWRE